MNFLIPEDVTEGVVHSVYWPVTRSCLGVIWRHKESGGIGHFVTVSQVRIQTSDGRGITGAFRPAGYAASNVNRVLWIHQKLKV